MASDGAERICLGGHSTIAPTDRRGQIPSPCVINAATLVSRTVDNGTAPSAARRFRSIANFGRDATHRLALAAPDVIARPQPWMAGDRRGVATARSDQDACVGCSARSESGTWDQARACSELRVGSYPTPQWRRAALGGLCERDRRPQPVFCRAMRSSPAAHPFGYWCDGRARRVPSPRQPVVASIAFGFCLVLPLMGRNDVPSIVGNIHHHPDIGG
jgi:hypothetical protein